MALPSAFTQPYREALQERVIAFTAEDWKSCRKVIAFTDEGDEESEEDEEDEENEEDREERELQYLHRNYPLPPAPAQCLVTILSSRNGCIVGTSLSGSETFVIDKKHVEGNLTAGQLLNLIAEIVGQETQNLTLLQAETQLGNTARISLEDGATLTLREAVGDARPLVMRRSSPEKRRVQGYLAAIGAVDIRYEQLPDDGAIQAIREECRYVTGKHLCWLVYTSKEVVSYGAGNSKVLEPMGYFPAAPCWRLPVGTRRADGCDVWWSQVHLPNLRPLLDEHAAKTNDRPIPRYQMIVDPNQFVDETDAGPVWVPCEFDVSSSQQVTLLGGDRSHAEPRLAEEVAKPVLQMALPLLAKLRRPQLLLEDRRLQVVFKAQRIIVPGSTGNGADSEYVGLWHVDGHRENVVAVVLYYYHVDAALQGGAMEFCGREPMDVLGYGDCDDENIDRFHRESLHAALRGTSSAKPKIANCRVPIREGTLLVFSNYQMAHRVLRMCNSSTHEASRDFVALFILDPACPPLKPARQVLSKGYATARALSLALKPAAVQLIQEFLGHRCSAPQRKARRNQMLKEQLRPSGEVCGGSQVYSTGNGCYSMIGWLHKMLDTHKNLSTFGGLHGEWKGKKLIRGLNLPPSQGRGMSEALSMDSNDLDRTLKEMDSMDPADMLE